MLRGFISSTVSFFVMSAVLLAVASLTLTNLYNVIDRSPNAATRRFVGRLLDELGLEGNTDGDICHIKGITCKGAYVQVNFSGMVDKQYIHPLPAVSPEWGPFVLVDNIDLSDAGITSTFPDSWRYLTQLKYLNLSKNPSLRGRVPDSWESLRHLEEINISGCSACHGLPAWYAARMPLRKVDFSHNQFRGRLSPYWEWLWSAEVYLHGNDFCGCVPSGWRGNLLTAVATMAVSGESCSANTCQNYDQCSGDINGDATTTTTAPTTTSYPNVTTTSYPNVTTTSYPNVTTTSYPISTTTAAPSTTTAAPITTTTIYPSSTTSPTHNPAVVGNDWATMQFMRSMYKEYKKALTDWTGDDYCKFSGVTCAANGEVTVDVSGRGLEDDMASIDKSWAPLSQVVSIDMSSNPGLDDSFQSDWRYLTNLRYLDLSYTNLKGSIPDKWRELTSLEEIHIASTYACKELPEWYSMPNLRVVDFSNNYLYGKLREQWGSLTGLMSVNLQNNRFCGCVPSAWASNQALMSAVEDSTMASARCASTTCYSSCP